MRNFKYLDDLIHNGVNEIVLDSDIVLSDSEESEYLEGIKLDVDDLVIDGQGYTIDANEKTRIFLVLGKNITLKNVTFINGKAKDGGAIYIDSECFLSLESCNFKANSSKDNFYAKYSKDNYGGAIFNSGSLSLVSCSFEGNSSLFCGGAIYNIGSLSLVSCSFEGNYSQDNGGAISNIGKLTMTESIFKDNISKDGENDIFNNGRIFSKQSFLKTLQINNIGIMHELKYLKTNQKDFSHLDELIHNDAKEIKLEYDLLLNIKNNEESRYSGGIDLDMDDLVIDGNGHIIDAQYLTRIFNCNAKNVTLKNITFKNAFGEDNGGAIFNSGSLSLVSCSFEDNFSKVDCGGAIFNSGSLSLVSCSFESNSSSSVGSAILNYDESSLSLVSCSFENISSIQVGGAIRNYGGSLSLVSCSFKGNSSVAGGGAIYNGNGSLSLESCSFKGNSSKNDLGGAIFNDGGGSLTLVSCSFEGNSSNSRHGGAIYNEYECSLTLVSCSFEGNSSKWSGGAICNRGSLSLASCSFEDNSSESHGGAIYLDISTEKYGSENCTFKDNTPDDVYEYKE